MKNKKILIALVFACIVYALLNIAFGRQGLSSPKYTVFNTFKEGTGVFYDTLKKMDYPVTIGYSDLDTNKSIHDIHVLINPSPMYYNSENKDDALSWVFNGGRLVFLYNNKLDIYDNSYELTPLLSRDDIELYSYGTGEILIAPYEGILNSTLLKDRKLGNILVNYFDKKGYENIIISEAIHGYKTKQSVVNKLPAYIKILISQLVLGFLMLIWMYGKRFGKIIPYYEEIEREENEYIKAVSVIYKNVGKGEIAISMYYDSFLDKASTYFSQNYNMVSKNIEKLWEINNLPHLEELKQINESILKNEAVYTRNRKGIKEFKKRIKTIKKLYKALN